MKCPTCGSFEPQVVDSREKTEGRRRRYKCPCGTMFTTVEMHVNPDRTGIPRTWDSSKILREQLMRDAAKEVKRRISELLASM